MMAQSDPATRPMNSVRRKSRAAIANQSEEQRPAAAPSLSLATIQRAMTNPHALAPYDILQLQRTAGNQAVQQLLQGRREASAAVAGRSAPTVQRRLQVGATNDRFEQEAEQVARQVVGSPAPIPSGKRAQAPATVQRQALGSFEAGGDFAGALKQTEGSGSALPAQTRAEFEPKFGADLGGVRIHTTPASNRLNRSIQAIAFTHGKDIHFRQGAYNPNSAQGKRLLAHELTHTIQRSLSGNRALCQA